MRTAIRILVIVLLALVMIMTLAGCDNSDATEINDLRIQVKELTDKLLYLEQIDNLNGDKGPTGDKGATGDQGPVGAQGPIGDKGATGDQGPVGAQGPVGDKGPTGDKGPAGDPADLTNLDNLIASNLYTLTREFEVGQQLDIYCNRELILSFAITKITNLEDTNIIFYYRVTFSKYVQRMTKIAEMFRLVSVAVDSEAETETYTYVPYAIPPSESIIIQPGSQNVAGSFDFGSNMIVSASTYFIFYIAIPGTDMPLATMIFNRVDLPST